MAALANRPDLLCDPLPHFPSPIPVHGAQWDIVLEALRLYKVQASTINPFGGCAGPGPSYGLGKANREEVLVSAVPLTFRVGRGREPDTLRVRVEGFDPITITAAQWLVLRAEGLGVVIARETPLQ